MRLDIYRGVDYKSQVLYYEDGGIDVPLDGWDVSMAIALDKTIAPDLVVNLTNVDGGVVVTLSKEQMQALEGEYIFQVVAKRGAEMMVLDTGKVSFINALIQ